jgi:F0F1-type ATP synthase assembly protein I
VTDERPKTDPVALALEWVAKITTVGLEMALPAIGGGYLDRHFGTTYWALVGVILGVTVGMWHLLQMTRPKVGGKGTRGEGTNGGA